MQRSISIILICVWASRSPAAPADAVVRLPSHGVSATVIHTEPGRTILLGCAHGFVGDARSRGIVLDVPIPQPGTGRDKVAVIRLLAVDYQADLALIELAAGPLPYFLPVAPPGFRSGRYGLSVGFDGMTWPSRRGVVTILGTGWIEVVEYGQVVTRAVTFTYERPGLGRSGGALCDQNQQYLIGVVHGYETRGGRRGLYISHAAICSFLQRNQAAWNPGALRSPIITEIRSPGYFDPHVREMPLPENSWSPPAISSPNRPDPCPGKT